MSCAGEGWGKAVPDSFTLYTSRLDGDADIATSPARGWDVSGTSYGIALTWRTKGAEVRQRRFLEDLTRQGYVARVEGPDLTIRRPPTQPPASSTSRAIGDGFLDPVAALEPRTPSSAVGTFAEALGLPPPPKDEGALGVALWGLGVLALAVAGWLTARGIRGRGGHGPDPSPHDGPGGA